MEKEKEIISLSPLYYYYDYSSPLLVVLNLFPDSFPNPNSSSPSTIQSSIFFPRIIFRGFRFSSASSSSSTSSQIVVAEQSSGGFSDHHLVFKLSDLLRA